MTFSNNPLVSKVTSNLCSISGTGEEEAEQSDPGKNGLSIYFHVIW